MDPQLAQRLQCASERVDAALEAFLRTGPGPVENLHDGVLYALGLDQEDPLLRGKRIRPALCLVVCETLGGDAEQAMPFALAIELMHNFFLVHDDIQDGDAYRRGRPSVWKRYGRNHAINIGDYLFTKVFSALLSARETDLGPEKQLALLAVLAEALEYTHVGQAQDMNARASRDIMIERYLEIVRNKTGVYLAAPLVGGAIVAGAGPETIEAIREMGRYAGPVFQIVDDTIDLTDGKGRERAGSDIREGKRSYLVAYTAERATATERDELFRILDLPRQETSDEALDWTRQLFATYGAVEAGRSLCRELMAQSHKALTPAPPDLRDVLIGVFEGLLERKR